MAARRTYAWGSRTRTPFVVINIKDDEGNWMAFHFSVADAGELADKVAKARETAWKNAWKPTKKGSPRRK